MTDWIKRLLFAFLVGTFGVLINLTPLGLELEEDLGLPRLFQLRGAAPAPPDVMVVAIDKASAVQLNLPVVPGLWPRDVHAHLIENLSEAGAKVIAFDLRFDTPGKVPEYDVALAKAINNAGNVVIVERLDREDSPLPAEQGGGAHFGSMVKSAALLPIIADAAAAQATFPLPRTSRINDYWAFKTDAGEAPTLPVVALQLFALDAYEEFARLLRDANPSLALRLPDRNSIAVENLILTLRGIFTDEPQLAQQMITALNRDARLDQQSRRLIRSMVSLYSGDEARYLNFYGPPRTVRTIPYYQALRSHHGSGTGGPTENDFKGKAVFVGFSAATQPEQDRIRDDYHTVFSRSDGLYLSGVEIAATAFANLLEDRPLRLLPPPLNLAIVFLWGFAIAIVVAALPQPTNITLGTVFVLLGLGFVSIYVYIAHHQFTNAGNWLPLIVPLLQVSVAVFGAVSLKYYDVKREREILKKAFAKFVPQRVVTEILKSTGPITTNNRLVHGACLATDADRYTTLSEEMNPAQLGLLMNDYYATMFEPVSRHEGAVSDVVGDAMLAIWTTSSGDESSLRKKACLACLDIADALERFNAIKGRPPLYTRIGLHSGEMLLGAVGALHHFEYRAVGDIVNTANRIQGLNKYLGTRLLVSEQVIEGLDDFLTRSVGRFLLAGRTTFIRVAELMGRKQEASSEQRWLAEIFTDAMLAYETQEWNGGCYNFAEILKAFPDDGPARFYLKRCQHYRETPPVGPWDACIRMEGK
ncbi:adenylate/guanylate cyclase domain-containing protein [Nitrosospira sp. Is2]|uniref:CHASE2 domain-containing protein n=1 Tax=Nitrosospira sp. Is2 TaxID=3080532 RepID=UPI002953FA76|nr:adenylate/guanylate cyclase domain-containing protein [Nitrosospira sp. Is2]WON74247.1 adenylate/guanylate cyclase domain-containing protein [Nitrosospira sp. Is2]